MPASAWAAAGHAAGLVLQRLFVSMTNGAATPRTLFDGLMVFVPKPLHSPDGQIDPRSSRRPSECRPLTLRNTDAKALTAAVAHTSKLGLARWADPAQRGFVAGRYGNDNLIEMDSRARALTAAHEAGDDAAQLRAALPEPDLDAAAPRTTPAAGAQVVEDPCMILFDFLQAFPSAAHWFIRSAVAATSPPEGAQAFLSCLIRPSRVVVRLQSLTTQSMRCSCGVAQGCPLSGMLFAITVDPCLSLLRHCVQPGGTLRAYADDLAALAPLPRQQLSKLAATFRCIRAASGLTLKPAKCRIVPLAPDTVERTAVERARSLVELYALTGEKLL